MANVPRPGAVTAMGILNLLIGVVGLLCCTCGAGLGGCMGYGVSQMPVPKAGEPDLKALFVAVDRDFPALKFALLAGVTTLLLLAVLFLVSGIGLLKMRQWGRKTAILTAVLFILYLLLSMGYSVAQGNRAALKVLKEMQEIQKDLAAKNNQPPPPAAPLPGDATAMNIWNAVDSLVFCIYPILLIWIMMLKSVRRAFAGEAPPTVPSEEIDRGWGDTAD